MGRQVDGLELVLTPSNERAGPVQNSQRGRPALGYSYLRVGYYCGRLSDSLTGPAKEHERGDSSSGDRRQSMKNSRKAAKATTNVGREWTRIKQNKPQMDADIRR